MSPTPIKRQSPCPCSEEANIDMLVACLAALIRRTGTGFVVIDDNDLFREMSNRTTVTLKHDAHLDCVRLTVQVLESEEAA